MEKSDVDHWGNLKKVIHKLVLPKTNVVDWQLDVKKKEEKTERKIQEWN